VEPLLASLQAAFSAEHRLDFGYPVPGSQPSAALHRLTWRGPGLMGILNRTPDSFSDGGELASLERALALAETMVRAGALVLDVGGESTRPGAQPVPLAEEERRVLPLVEALAARGWPVLISVDTRKAPLARAALASGAHLVNLVGGLRGQDMLAACAERGAPAALCHLIGEPATMQRGASYQDVLAEVSAWLSGQAALALRAGIPSVLLDPGLGFGKGAAHNLTLLRGLRELTALGHPLLVGGSRKGTIGAIAGEKDPKARDPGSVALHLWAALEGAALLRVHAVAEHAQALAVWRALAFSGPAA
jgi:dihydropteroate synthase